MLYCIVCIFLYCLYYFELVVLFIICVLFCVGICSFFVLNYYFIENNENIRLHDIGDLDLHTFLQQTAIEHSTDRDSLSQKIFIVTPEQLENNLNLELECENLNLVKQIWPHFSSEHLPKNSIFSSDGGLNLNMYRYRNNCKQIQQEFEE